MWESFLLHNGTVSTNVFLPPGILPTTCACCIVRMGTLCIANDSLTEVAVMCMSRPAGSDPAGVYTQSSAGRPTSESTFMQKGSPIFPRCLTIFEFF
jgi:hypothetical protein